jgi:hypothetical protein
MDRPTLSEPYLRKAGFSVGELKLGHYYYCREANDGKSWKRKKKKKLITKRTAERYRDEIPLFLHHPPPSYIH